MKKVGLFVTIVAFVILYFNYPGEKMSAELTFPLPSIELDLNPHKYDDLYSMIVIQQIYRGLFSFTPEGGLKQSLVKAWSVDPNFTEFRFELREAYFSNGVRVNSKHVRNTFAKVFRDNAAIATDIGYIAGVREYLASGNIEDFGVKVESQYKVTFSLTQPVAIFISQLAVPDLSILPLESPEQNLDFDRELITSGPYYVQSKTQSKITLKKLRESDLDSINPPEYIHFIAYENERHAIDLAVNGKVDSLDYIDVDRSVEEVLVDKEWAPFLTNSSVQWFAILSPSIPIEVRQWLTSKLYNTTEINSMAKGRVRPAYGLIPDTLAGHLGEGEAVSLPDGEVHSDISISVDYFKHDLTTLRLVEIAKRAWKHQRIKLEFRALEMDEYFNRMFGRKSEIVIGKKGIDFPDGYGVLSYFYSNSSTSYFYNSNREIDKLLSLAIGYTDFNQRILFYKKAQKLILKESTFVPLLFGQLGSGLWSDKIESVPEHPLGIQYLPFESIVLK